MSEPDWLEFIETILVYKLPRLGREELRKMLGFKDVDLKQTKFYQEVFSEGHQEGRQEGEATLLRRQLIRRFGGLPEAVETRLTQASTEQLETWGERVLDAPSLAAVFGDDAEREPDANPDTR